MNIRTIFFIGLLGLMVFPISTMMQEQAFATGGYASDDCTEGQYYDEPTAECQRIPPSSADDKDGDYVIDTNDNCPEIFNKHQNNRDGDKFGDVCDDDIDGDGILNENDNCVKMSNANQMDHDGDLKGDRCDFTPYTIEQDGDQDNKLNEEDNCVSVYNPNQNDMDLNGIGNKCDTKTEQIPPMQHSIKVYEEDNALVVTFTWNNPFSFEEPFTIKCKDPQWEVKTVVSVVKGQEKYSATMNEFNSKHTIDDRIVCVVQQLDENDHALSQIMFGHDNNKWGNFVIYNVDLTW